MLKRLIAFIGLFATVSVVLAQTKEFPDFTALVEKQGAAVVNISATQKLRNNRAMPGFPFDEDDPAFQFFRRFGPGGQAPEAPQEFENKSTGSGFIISADGYILTNRHVVADASEVQVKLIDKREFKARVLGTDRRTDVALLKIEAGALPFVTLGDPGRLKVGEWVVAIGSPFGLENSVTAGIVSAKGRSLPQENYVPFIQTDAAINPGNSGGPLFNMKGEVVGINSQIYSRSGGYMGLSFAIPIDLALDVKNQLLAHGKVSRGRIGVVIQDVTKELAESFGLGKTQGALVAKVEKGTPAEKAGLQEGDIILKFDGKAVTQSSDLPRMVGVARPGSLVVVQVWRKGAMRDLSVGIAEMPDEDNISQRDGKGRGKTSEAANLSRFGIIATDITPEQKKQAGIDHGVLVDTVRSSRGDLRPGDVILALVSKGSTTEIKSVEQLDTALGKLEKGTIASLQIKRGDGQTFVPIKGLGESR